MSETDAKPCSCDALRQAARHLTRLFDEALATVGLSLNQYAILAKLDRFGPHVLQDLARRSVMDRSTLGHLLRPLEARGIVTIGLSDADRRRRIIALTPEGMALMQTAKPLWAGAERAFEEAFGIADAASLRSLLKRLTKVQFAADWQEAPPAVAPEAVP